MALKILLADDSMTAQNMGKKILTEAGYDVVTVSNGAAAAKKLTEVEPDLAILDVYMPGYTGLEVCERIKSSPSMANVPVLLTVGKMEPFRPEDGMKAKANGVVIKPFEATDLLNVVEKLVQFSQPVSTPAAGPEEMAAPTPGEAEHFPEHSNEAEENVAAADGLQTFTPADLEVSTPPEPGIEFTARKPVGLVDVKVPVEFEPTVLSVDEEQPTVNPSDLLEHFGSSGEKEPAPESASKFSASVLDEPSAEPANTGLDMPDFTDELEQFASAVAEKDDVSVASEPITEAEQNSDPSEKPDSTSEVEVDLGAELRDALESPEGGYGASNELDELLESSGGTGETHTEPSEITQPLDLIEPPTKNDNAADESPAHERLVIEEVEAGENEVLPSFGAEGAIETVMPEQDVLPEQTDKAEETPASNEISPIEPESGDEPTAVDPDQGNEEPVRQKYSYLDEFLDEPESAAEDVDSAAIEAQMHALVSQTGMTEAVSKPAPVADLPASNEDDPLALNVAEDVPPASVQEASSAVSEPVGSPVIEPITVPAPGTVSSAKDESDAVPVAGEDEMNAMVERVVDRVVDRLKPILVVMVEEIVKELKK